MTSWVEAARINNNPWCVNKKYRRYSNLLHKLYVSRSPNETEKFNIQSAFMIIIYSRALRVAAAGFLTFTYKHSQLNIGFHMIQKKLRDHLSPQFKSQIRKDRLKLCLPVLSWARFCPEATSHPHMSLWWAVLLNVPEMIRICRTTGHFVMTQL